MTEKCTQHLKDALGYNPQDVAFSQQNPSTTQVGGTHYTDMAAQPWDVMQSVLSHAEFVGFLKGNIIKYAMRQGRKDGSDDAAKAQHYRQKLAEILSYD